ncbi:hypothetical protein CEXT_519611 [Caerostris extrusa]|uniref:Uncharacterized protein n=1 Tax=Caerostris extrusa TaxID=172846 RepID=A0AAV4TPC1_CAEEX|nr:hypothetical protein CEXT_519611 [Caerostris extrusa]
MCKLDAQFGLNTMEIHLIKEFLYMSVKTRYLAVDGLDVLVSSYDPPDHEVYLLLNFYLWGVMKAIVYETPADSETDLVARIEIAVVMNRETFSIFEMSNKFSIFFCTMSLFCFFLSLYGLRATFGTLFSYVILIPIIVFDLLCKLYVELRNTLHVDLFFVIH